MLQERDCTLELLHTGDMTRISAAKAHRIAEFLARTQHIGPHMPYKYLQAQYHLGLLPLTPIFAITLELGQHNLHSNLERHELAQFVAVGRPTKRRKVLLTARGEDSKHFP